MCDGRDAEAVTKGAGTSLVTHRPRVARRASSSAVMVVPSARTRVAGPSAAGRSARTTGPGADVDPLLCEGGGELGAGEGLLGGERARSGETGRRPLCPGWVGLGEGAAECPQTAHGELIGCARRPAQHSLDAR